MVDELNDDALSDGGDEELTAEQQVHMDDGLEQVRLIVGNADVSGLSDKSITDILWDSYFDIEKTVNWALEEQAKRQVAKDRKGNGGDYASTTSDGNYEDRSEQYYQDQEGYEHPYPGSRLPSIFMAQQQSGFDNQAHPEVSSTPHIKRLSTISEKTERTEPIALWRPRHQYPIPDTPCSSAPSSATTSYGEEIVGLSQKANRLSGSTIRGFSTNRPPPLDRLENDIGHFSPINERNFTFKDLPSIPDLHSKSSLQGINDITAPIPLLSSGSKSKLSKLASSKASSVSARSESSRSTGTSGTGTLKTYPALRPSAQSVRPLSSVGSSKELPDTPSNSSGSKISSTSSIVRRAINAAMELENMGNSTISRPFEPAFPEEDLSKTPAQVDFKKSIHSNDEMNFAQTRPLSKLAVLAQQKAEAANRSLPSLNISPPSVITARPLSKLAVLAQQKVDATRVPKLPKTTTEYLTPIANGSSVTTAITTSYQSLYSLTDPSRPNVIPKLDVVPLQYMSGPPASSSNPKASKLAMKVKRVGEKVGQLTTPEPTEETATPISPIFQTSPTRARASPSAFASVLIYNTAIPPEDTMKEKGSKLGKEKRYKKHRKSPEDPSFAGMKHIHPFNLDALAGSSNGSTFTFDGPSPDDVVLNARKRSALGPKPSAKLSTGSKSHPSS
ncbi:hypothetical protein HYPSUDRAFT_200464 [Hypholoma sublateritium FD-334 SS-4]|uniref:HBS1-like protein N-terminal domain-containing protein n=1 Tax=Hypholoma sublateritium (strain FD-334 SS-4) TaxID=945553 RepID=A0A0D2P7G2_HYPSF|nr:hypothetical protein HYPSUDRAFT_200464 [Hypholoma sublateritium FD-334 SS-4]